MKTESKLIIMISIIDENFARLFLQETPLKDAVKDSIDLNSLENKIAKVETYVDSEMKKMLKGNSTEFLSLKSEAVWSLNQCDKNLRFLTSSNSDCIKSQLNNADTILKLIIRYKNLLSEILKYN